MPGGQFTEPGLTFDDLGSGGGNLGIRRWRCDICAALRTGPAFAFTHAAVL
jgi:hypothetical protein